MKKINWYNSTWFMWLALIFFAPLGIFLMWKNKRYYKVFRISLSIMFSLVFLFTLVGVFGEPVENTQVDTTAIQTGNDTTTITATVTDTSDKKELSPSSSSESAQIASTVEETTPVTIPSTDVAGQNLIVHYIDVGQADSILIQQDNNNMLIDAGNNADANLIVDYLKSNGIKKIDTLILTHPHEDHIGGADLLIKTFEIDKIYMPKVTATTQTFIDVVNAMKAKNLNATIPVPGTKFTLGDAACTILAPNSNSYENMNDFSIVLKLTFGEKAFLFTGDAEALSEEEMIKKDFDLKADVLKIGHHGSSSSTSDAFLKKVSPQYAVLSVGKDNSYGHPHKITMDRLKAAAIEVYRTDECGTIVCTSDGTDISFSTKPGDYAYNEVDGSSMDIKPSVSLKPEPTATPAITPTPKPVSGGIIISDIDKKGEIVTITNNSSEDINLKGWKLVSVTGNQQYTFPDYTLKTGKSVKIASGDVPGDLKWSKANIWNNSKSDPGELYDNTGKLIFSYDD